MKITLTAARINAGFTQDSAVLALKKQGHKISVNTLANYENYRTIPDFRISEAIADLYGVSVNDIIFYRKIVV